MGGWMAGFLGSKLGGSPGGAAPGGGPAAGGGGGAPAPKAPDPTTFGYKMGQAAGNYLASKPGVAAVSGAVNAFRGQPQGQGAGPGAPGAMPGGGLPSLTLGMQPPNQQAQPWMPDQNLVNGLDSYLGMGRN